MLSWAKRDLQLEGLRSFIETALLGRLAQMVADYLPKAGETVIFQVNFTLHTMGDDSALGFTHGSMHVYTGTDQETDISRERLAAYAHEAWSGWMKYQFEKGHFMNGHVEGGGLADVERVWVMPAWAVERWQRQMNTKYDDLPEEEKASDHKEADRMLAIMKGEKGGG